MTRYSDNAGKRRARPVALTPQSEYHQVDGGAAGGVLMFDVIADPVFVGGSRLNAGRLHDFQERLHSGR